MATGQEHYREAERLLAQSKDSMQGVQTFLKECRQNYAPITTSEVDSMIAAVNAGIARAQVHATLAQTAAAIGPVTFSDGDHWRETLYPQGKGEEE